MHAHTLMHRILVLPGSAAANVLLRTTKKKKKKKSINVIGGYEKPASFHGPSGQVGSQHGQAAVHPRSGWLAHLAAQVCVTTPRNNLQRRAAWTALAEDSRSRACQQSARQQKRFDFLYFSPPGSSSEQFMIKTWPSNDAVSSHEAVFCPHL